MHGEGLAQVFADGLAQRVRIARHAHRQMEHQQPQPLADLGGVAQDHPARCGQAGAGLLRHDHVVMALCRVLELLPAVDHRELVEHQQQPAIGQREQGAVDRVVLGGSSACRSPNTCRLSWLRARSPSAPRRPRGSRAGRRSAGGRGRRGSWWGRACGGRRVGRAPLSLPVPRPGSLARRMFAGRGPGRSRRSCRSRPVPRRCPHRPMPRRPAAHRRGREQHARGLQQAQCAVPREQPARELERTAHQRALPAHGRVALLRG